MAKEVDGKQHYANGDSASPQEYARMVSEDRRLRLPGYEVYQFGGYELSEPERGESIVKNFFMRLVEMTVVLLTVASRCKSASSYIYAIKPVELLLRDNSRDDIFLPW